MYNMFYWFTDNQSWTIMTLLQGHSFDSPIFYRNNAVSETELFGPIIIIIIIGVNVLFPSGLWCQCSAGPDSRPKEHLHRDAILDGSWGHRLWWKPRCYLRLQGEDSASESNRNWTCWFTVCQGLDVTNLMVCPVEWPVVLWNHGHRDGRGSST